MFVFEGTPEEISAVARSMLPATTGDIALSLEVQDEARAQSSERPTKFVTVDFARRVLGRRPVLSKPFKRVLGALNDAYPDWMLLRELHSAADYTAAQFAGLMGAFGRRMAHTEGHDKDADFFETRWNDDEEAWEYRLPATVYEAWNPHLRPTVNSLSSSKLKKLAMTRGSMQHFAFDELARRIREDPSSWSPNRGVWAWERLDIREAPSAIAAEWAFLTWSQQLNEGKNPGLEQEQGTRLEELERHLEQDPESHEISRKFHDVIGKEVRAAAGLA